MLFNSYLFIGLFLPISLIGFFLIARASHIVAALWLGLASLFFYGWWDPRYVGLLLLSIVFNFAVGRAISKQRERLRLAIQNTRRWLTHKPSSCNWRHQWYN
mgnify:CR=1 FL=1